MSEEEVKAAVRAFCKKLVDYEPDRVSSLTSIEINGFDETVDLYPYDAVRAALLAAEGVREKQRAAGTIVLNADDISVTAKCGS